MNLYESYRVGDERMKYVGYYINLDRCAQ